MTLGLIVYLWSGHRLADVGHPPASDAPRPWGKLLLVLAGAAALFAFSRISDTNPKLEWLRYGYVVIPVVAILWFGFHGNPDFKRIAAVLVFSRTTGFRHESIPAALRAIQELGTAVGFGVHATEDPAAFSPANLSRYANPTAKKNCGMIESA